MLLLNGPSADKKNAVLKGAMAPVADDWQYIYAFQMTIPEITITSA